MIDTWERAWAEFVPFLAFPMSLDGYVTAADPRLEISHRAGRAES